MENNNQLKKHRRIEGVVTSDKMQKTIVVAIVRTKTHPKYLKRYNVSRKFKVHDENNEYKIGDRVVIEETRPISKEKRWKVVELIAKAKSTQE